MGNPSDDLPDSFLRLIKFWVMLPFLAYFFAIPALGPGALFVPIVVAYAPLGILSFFQNVSLDEDYRIANLVIHLIFWSLMVTGIMGRHRIPLPLLRAIWLTLVIMLILSVGGCNRSFGEGLRSPGNWH